MTQLRRIKSHVLARPWTAELRFARGWGDVAGDETRQILADLSVPPKFQSELSVDRSRVIVSKIDVRNLLELALRLRTAQDLMWRLETVRVLNERSLRTFLRSVEWELFFEQETRAAVRAVSSGSALYHTGLVKEIAAECLSASGVDVVPFEDAEQLVELRVKNDVLTLALSCGHPSLAHRGYKAVLCHPAPLREDLAAAVLSWACPADEEHEALYVPFAGSGTFGFEALMLAGRIAPSLFGRTYPVERLKCMTAETRRHIRHRLLGRLDVSTIDEAELVEIMPELATDLAQNVQRFTSSCGAARTSIRVTCADFFSSEPKVTGELPLLVPLNPPFGDRLGSSKGSVVLYGNIGERLRDILSSRGGRGTLLSPSPPCSEAFRKRLRPDDFRSRGIVHGGKKLEVIAWRKRRDLR